MYRMLISLILPIAMGSSAVAACNQINDADRLRCYDEEAGYTPPKTDDVAVTEIELSQAFGANTTEAGRVAAWENIEAKYGEVTGRIRDVDAPGFLSKDYRAIMDGPNELTLFCRISERNEHIAVSLKVGEKFTCKGLLDDYMFILGSGSVTIRYSE